MDSASYSAYESFSLHFEEALDQAFLDGTVYNGWRRSGMIPYDPVQIISGWAGWNSTPTAEAATILSRKDTLVDHIKRIGFLNDDTIEAVMAGIPSLVFDPTTRKGNDISPQNKRGCWMSSPGYCEEYRRIEAEKAAVEAQRLASAASKEAKRQRAADVLAEKRRRADDNMAGGGSLLTRGKTQVQCTKCYLLVWKPSTQFDDGNLCPYKPCSFYWCSRCTEHHAQHILVCPYRK